MEENVALRLRFGFWRLKQNIKRLPHILKGKELQNFLFSAKGALIRPWQFESELAELVSLLENLNPKRVMEIGTANGGTLFLECRLANPSATIISVDLPEGRYGGGYPIWKIPVYQKFALPGQNIKLIRASSHDISTLEQVKKILNTQELDFLFIDGDHTYEGVKKDFQLYSPMVRKGGIIVFHDIVPHIGSSCQVDKFWNEIKQSYPFKEFVKQPRENCFGIGVLEYTK